MRTPSRACNTASLRQCVMRGLPSRQALRRPSVYDAPARALEARIFPCTQTSLTTAGGTRGRCCTWHEPPERNHRHPLVDTDIVAQGLQAYKHVWLSHRPRPAITDAHACCVYYTKIRCAAGRCWITPRQDLRAATGTHLHTRVFTSASGLQQLRVQLATQQMPLCMRARCPCDTFLLGRCGAG